MINESYYLSSLEQSTKYSDPFDHLLINNFLEENTFQSILTELATLELSNPTKNFETAHGNKKEYREFNQDLKVTRVFLDFLASDIFCSVLKQKFGVPSELSLKFDGTFDGGGYVISPPDSFLTYHADFNFSSNTKMYRSINILFYLNEQYNSNFGGKLHLLDPKTKTVEKIVEPVANTLLAFRTDDISFHGVSKNKNGFFRRSFNIYYYTDQPISKNQSQVPHKTIWIDPEQHDH
jgi:hypothetical protein